MSRKNSPGQQPVFLSAFIIGQFILFGCPVQLTAKSSFQERSLPRPDVELEIILPGSSRGPFKLMVINGRRIGGLIHRQHLKINDPDLAAAFTAIDVWADGEPNAVRVRLSIIYNDLSNQEWWKDKKEKVAGSLLIREGESARLPELAQFGIEPFEIKATKAGPVEFQPGHGPRIINNTKSLEVVVMGKLYNLYQIRIKNHSPKDVVAYKISTGNSTVTNSSSGHAYGNVPPIIPAGATHEDDLLGLNADEEVIRIPVVVFADGSFEGDAKLAAAFLATEQGIRIQAPHVLRMVDQALQVDDAELQTSFLKLEAQLWAIPEAIDKQSAIDLLKSKYSSFDDKTINGLYEELKGGLYEARNRALSPLGDTKRNIQEDEQGQKSDANTRATMLREVLKRIKNDLEIMIASTR
jgi:hypothetical protein